MAKEIHDLRIHYICDTGRSCCDSKACQEECIHTSMRENAKHEEVVNAYYEFILAMDKLKRYCDLIVYDRYDDDGGVVIDILERRRND